MCQALLSLIIYGTGAGFFTSVLPQVTLVLVRMVLRVVAHLWGNGCSWKTLTDAVEENMQEAITGTIGVVLSASVVTMLRGFLTGLKEPLKTSMVVQVLENMLVGAVSAVLTMCRPSRSSKIWRRSS